MPKNNASLTAVIQIPDIEGEWQQMTLPIANSGLLSAGVTLALLDAKGIVFIASISLVNRATADVLWVAKGQELQELHQEGTAIPLPDDENLVLVTGEGARIVLPAEIDVPDCPLDLSIWIKVSQDLEQLRRVIGPLPTKAEKELVGMVRQAESAESGKDWKSAIGLWQKAFQHARQQNLQPPQDATARIASARIKLAAKLRLEKSYSAAQAALAPVLQTVPQHPEALTELLRIEVGQKNWAAVLETSQALLAHHDLPLNTVLQTFQHQVQALRNLNQTEQARVILESQRGLGLLSGSQAYQLAIIYRDAGRFGEAEELVRDIATKHEDLAKIIGFATFAAQLLWKSKNFAEAREILQRAIKATDTPFADLPLTTQAIFHELDRRLAPDGDQDNLEVTREYYDEIYVASEKYTSGYQDSIYLPVWEKVQEVIRANNLSAVVDIGCGPGQFAEYLLQSLPGVAYTGHDYSRTAISNARQRCPRASFVESDVLAEDAPFQAEADVFVMLEVLEHIEQDLTILEKVPAGQWLILSVPNFDSFGHIRFFKDEAEVLDRYGPYVDEPLVQTVDLGGRSRIFLVSGVRSGHGKFRRGRRAAAARSDAPPRVCLLTAGPVQGEVRVVRTAGLLQSHGYDVRVFGVNRRPETARLDQYPFPVTLASNPTRSMHRDKVYFDLDRNMNYPEYLARLRDTLLELLGAEPFDVLHTHDMPALPLGALLQDRLETPAAGWIHDLTMYTAGALFVPEPRRQACLRLEQQHIHQPDVLITASPLLAEAIAADYTLPRPPLVALTAPWHAGAPHDQARSGLQAPVRSVRQAAAVGHDAFLMVYCGPVRPESDLECAVQALSRAPLVHLALTAQAGAGYAETLRDLARSLGAEDQLHFVPPVPAEQLSAYIRDANAGLCTAKPSPHAELALEAHLLDCIHADLPVICADTRAHREFLTTYPCGLLYNTGSAESLSMVMEQARARGGRAVGDATATEDLRVELSWEEQGKVVLEACRELAGEVFTPEMTRQVDA